MENIHVIFNSVAEEENITIGALERAIGASKGVLSRALKNGTDVQSKWLSALIEKYPQYPYDKWLRGKFSPIENSILKETAAPYPEEKDTSKQIDDLAYTINRRFNDLEEGVKQIMLDVSELKIKSQELSLEKVKEAIDSIEVLRAK